MDKRPTCTFPYIKIIGEIKEENDRIVFKGITDDEGMGEFYFTATAEVKQSIIVQSLSAGSEVTIHTYMNLHSDEDGVIREPKDNNFEVISIENIK